MECVFDKRELGIIKDAIELRLAEFSTFAKNTYAAGMALDSANVQYGILLDGIMKKLRRL